MESHRRTVHSASLLVETGIKEENLLHESGKEVSVFFPPKKQLQFNRNLVWTSLNFVLLPFLGKQVDLVRAQAGPRPVMVIMHTHAQHISCEPSLNPPQHGGICSQQRPALAPFLPNPRVELCRGVLSGTLRGPATAGSSGLGCRSVAYCTSRSPDGLLVTTVTVYLLTTVTRVNAPCAPASQACDTYNKAPAAQFKSNNHRLGPVYRQ